MGMTIMTRITSLRIGPFCKSLSEKKVSPSGVNTLNLNNYKRYDISVSIQPMSFHHQYRIAENYDSGAEANPSSLMQQINQV